MLPGSLDGTDVGPGRLTSVLSQVSPVRHLVRYGPRAGDGTEVGVPFIYVDNRCLLG